MPRHFSAELASVVRRWISDWCFMRSASATRAARSIVSEWRAAVIEYAQHVLLPRRVDNADAFEERVDEPPVVDHRAVVLDAERGHDRTHDAHDFAVGRDGLGARDDGFTLRRMP